MAFFEGHQLFKNKCQHYEDKFEPPKKKLHLTVPAIYIEVGFRLMVPVKELPQPARRRFPGRRGLHLTVTRKQPTILITKR